MKKKFLIIIILFLAILIPISTFLWYDDYINNQKLYSEEGYIIEKEIHKEVYRLLLIQNISQEDIETKNKMELIQEAIEKTNATWVHVSKSQYDKVELHNKIRVEYETGSIAESNPAQGSAKSIEIIKWDRGTGTETTKKRNLIIGN